MASTITAGGAPSILLWYNTDSTIESVKRPARLFFAIFLAILVHRAYGPKKSVNFSLDFAPRSLFPASEVYAFNDLGTIGPISPKTSGKCKCSLLIIILSNSNEKQLQSDRTLRIEVNDFMYHLQLGISHYSCLGEQSEMTLYKLFFSRPTHTKK